MENKLQNSNATENSRDPDKRYLYGIDRWNKDEEGLESITWRCANFTMHSISDEGLVWWWSYEEKIWYLLHEPLASIARADLIECREVLREGVILVKLLVDAKDEFERHAARRLLAVIGRRATDWQNFDKGRPMHLRYNRPGDHYVEMRASDVYSTITKSDRHYFEIAGVELPPFSDALYEEISKAEFAEGVEKLRAAAAAKIAGT
ncbi:hypothetical protein [Sediminicoccus sp. BL-A-41-H5]|uniref:hypothetical protein n=1 Tax=Sediminicoccus sp. BL-A-41-H5 TaxID=3421106 RepID=UPI003D675809